MKLWTRGLLATLLALAALGASAQDAATQATIRKNLAERLPELPKIDEISKTPVPGIYEIRVSDNDVYYTDADGSYLFQGQLIDVKQKRNLTEDRITQLTALDFKDLPTKDAFVLVRGNGKRKLAVFADPNCGYCKRFEADLAKIDNVTIYTFLYPILGGDSGEKSRNIWCAKDRSKTWLSWMLNGQPAPAASCDVAALNRNLALGRKHKITGTPTLIFADGTRIPGALTQQQIEKQMATATN